MKEFKIVFYAALVLWCFTLVFLLIAYNKEEKLRLKLIQKQEIVDTQQEQINRLMAPVVKKQLSWNTFIMALAYVESKWNDTVVNPLSGATGFLQLTEVYVDQINIWGYNYSYEDRFNRSKSIEMFEITNKILNPQKDFHLALVIHNPKATIKYHNAVMQKYESLKSKYERR